MRRHGNDFSCTIRDTLFHRALDADHFALRKMKGRHKFQSGS